MSVVGNSLNSAVLNAGIIGDFTNKIGRDAVSFVRSNYGKPLLFPTEWQHALSDFHVGHHLPGPTGAWMDSLKGPFHRIFHGHHLVEDGIYVLFNPELKFGEFLHHLGMDFLSTTGIPIVPKKLIQALVEQGISESALSNWFSLNLAKTLEGGLALVCSGYNVLMALTDSIPHTFSSAGIHFALGCFDLASGFFTKNILFFSCALNEFFTSAMTCYRAVTDPIIPMLGVPGSVFYPVLFQSMIAGGLIGGTLSALRGKPFSETLKTASIGSLSSAAAAFSKYAFASFAAPVVAGAVTFFVAKKLFDTIIPPEVEEPFYKVGKVGNDNGFFRNGTSRLTLPSRLTSPSTLNAPSTLHTPSTLHSVSKTGAVFRNVPADMDTIVEKLNRNPIGFIDNGRFYPNTQGLRNAF